MPKLLQQALDQTKYEAFKAFLYQKQKTAYGTLSSSTALHRPPHKRRWMIHIRIKNTTTRKLIAKNAVEGTKKEKKPDSAVTSVYVVSNINFQVDTTQVRRNGMECYGYGVKYYTLKPPNHIFRSVSHDIVIDWAANANKPGSELFTRAITRLQIPILTGREVTKEVNNLQDVQMDRILGRHWWTGYFFD